MPTLSPPEPITSGHDLTLFSCGEASLDDWLRRRALANQASGASRTFVVRRDDVVVAYYCLAAGAVALAAAPGKVRRNMPDPIPVVVLGRLAVDQALHGQGIGRALLRDAVQRTLQASQVLGVRALLVQALHEEARAFYLACGMMPSPFDRMVLMATIADLMAALG